MKRIISLCFAAAVLAVPAMAAAQTPQEVLARFSHEPSIQDTLDAAEDYMGLDSDRLEGLYMRAGGAKALPKKVYYEMTYRDQEKKRDQEMYNYKNGETKTYDYYRLSNYTEPTEYLQHKVHAEWDLSAIVFNTDQLRVVSMMNSSAKNRDAILKAVTKAYFARRKLQVESTLNPPTDVAQKLEQELKIQELTANLDALTGGWFSEQLRNKRN